MLPGGGASSGKVNGCDWIVERKIIETRDVEVEVAIAIIIDEGDAERQSARRIGRRTPAASVTSLNVPSPSL